jgi:histidine triad (HIT) family protein
MAQCIFCRIAKGEMESDVVHASDNVVAFRDLNPQAPVHILLIPREHVPSVRELTASHGGLLTEMVAVAARLAREEGVDDGGWRLVTNVGADAGQSVPHLHFHLLGGRRMAWPPG